MAAPINHEHYDVKNWINNKLKRLQLSNLKPKEILKTHEFVEEEKKDEEDGWKKILDSLSQTRKGRPRKNRIMPTSRRNKKKSDHDDNVSVNNVAQNQAQHFT